MAELSKNWLTEKHIDFEYKKYLLLAYLQEVKKSFDSTKLYPWLAEIIQHYKEAIAVRDNKQNLQKHFPQKLSGINAGGLTFENLIDDDDLMKEIEQVVEYAIPQFETRVEEGKSIYDIVERRHIIDEHFNRFNFEIYGGVPVLGVNKPVIIGHGISHAQAFDNMIQMAKKMHEEALTDKIRNAFL